MEVMRKIYIYSKEEEEQINKELGYTQDPKYEYSQLSVYEYADHSGFTVDYEMTSNSELVDLTLQLKFLYTNSGFHIILLNVEPQ